MVTDREDQIYRVPFGKKWFQNMFFPFLVTSYCSLPLNPPHKKPSPLSTTLSLIYIPRFSNFHYALLSLLNPSKERDGCSGHACSIFLTEGGGSFLQCGTKESCIKSKKGYKHVLSTHNNHPA